MHYLKKAIDYEEDETCHLGIEMIPGFKAF
jgi:hypothetical protein